MRLKIVGLSRVLLHWKAVRFSPCRTAQFLPDGVATAGSRRSPGGRGVTHRALTCVQFAVAVAVLMPQARIYLFRAAPILRATIAGKQPKVRPGDRFISLALGNREGEIAFHVNSHSHSSSVLRQTSVHKQAFPDAIGTGAIPVKISTLDAVASALDLQPPIMVKLDVQGYEKETLYGRGANPFTHRLRGG